MDNSNFYRQKRDEVSASANTNIETHKKWRIGEETARNLASVVKSDLKMYVLDGDENYLRHAQLSCERESSPQTRALLESLLGGDIGRKIKELKEKPDAERHAANSLLKALTKRTMALEIKYLKLMAGRGEDIGKYMTGLDTDEKHNIVQAFLSDYKNNRTDSNRTKTNSVLGYLNKKIVRVLEQKTTLDERKVVRYDFEGAFVLPNVNDVAGYSSGYKKFVRENPAKNVAYRESDYNLENNPALKTLCASNNMALMRKRIEGEMLNLIGRVSPEEFNQLNISDFAHMMYKTKNPNGTEPFPEVSRLDFRDLEPQCDEGIKFKFWREFCKDNAKMAFLEESMREKGADENFIKDTVNAIRVNNCVSLKDAKNPDVYKQPTPDISIHHKFYIQDATGLEKITSANELGNFVVAIDFDGNEFHKKGLHGVDITADGYSERLVDTRDGQGENLVVVAGWGKEYYAPGKDGRERTTYLAKEIVSDAGRE